MATQTRQQDLDKIMEEGKKLQERYEGKRWDKDDRVKFDALMAEGLAIQDEIESESKLETLERREKLMREVPEPSIPNARNHPDQGKGGDREVAGYVSVGDFVLASNAFRGFAAGGYARGQHAIVQVPGAMCGKNVVVGPQGAPMVAVTKQQRKEIRDFFESKEAKAVPTIGSGIIEPERIARIPQVTADERLTIRDIVSTGQTGSSSVEYVREESFSMAAEPTAHGAEKPEEDVEYTLQQAPVRTIAGWMPVQNQQLEDWAQLRSLIDGRLRYSVRRAEEEQIMFGNGTPPNIEGLMTVAGTTNIETNGRYNGSNHTLIDVVRMGITDVLIRGYSASAVAIHPIDWETILLEKGTDDRYVWAVVTDQNGSRIWGLRAVETIGAQSRADGRRTLIVGDWQMGAQLLDRMQLTVQVGLIDRQFVENMRTILAEERIAFPIYAPKAFAYFETAEAS